MDGQVAAGRRPEFDTLVGRVRGEYEEMPGLCLTIPQLARLYGIDPTTSKDVLVALVTDRYLRRASSGAYGRTDTMS